VEVEKEGGWSQIIGSEDEVKEKDKIVFDNSKLLWIESVKSQIMNVKSK